MSRPLTDAELDEILQEHHCGMLQEMMASFARSQPDGQRQDSPLDHMDPADTDGLNSHVLLQVAVGDLMSEISAHLGREGELVVVTADNRLRSLLEGLRNKTLSQAKALELTTALSEAEQHLRSMVELDYASSTCRRTRQALDQLRSAIARLGKQVLTKLGSETCDLAQH